MQQTDPITNNISDHLVTLPSHQWSDLVSTALISLILGAVIVAIVVGNLFVILAILNERHLQRPQNYLIVSLAVSDIAVGLLVLPVSLIYEVTRRRWILGATMCNIWIFSDVSACSASILNMVAIALDRYWSVTNIHYSQKRKTRSMLVMIAIVWLISLLISSLPMIGWKDSNYEHRIDKAVCLVSQELGFQVFSTITAFYAPLVIILSLYVCIYRAAKQRIRRRQSSMAVVKSNNSYSPAKVPLIPCVLGVSKPATSAAVSPSASPTSACMSQPVLNRRQSTISIGSINSLRLQATEVMRSPLRLFLRREQKPMASISSDMSSRRSSTVSRILEASRVEITMVNPKWLPEDLEHRNMLDPDSPPLKLSNNNKMPRRKISVEQRRERKAFQTLAIVTGAFIICWLPFFVVALARPLCNCEISRTLDAIFAWLGWSNSLLNPVIYTIFSPDFRNAFRKILYRILPLRCLEPQTPMKLIQQQAAAAMGRKRPQILVCAPSNAPSPPKLVARSPVSSSPQL